MTNAQTETETVTVTEKKKPGRAAYAAEQVDTSLCMIESVRKYLSRNGKVVAEEIRRLLAAADLTTDAVPRVRPGRTRQAETLSKRRNIRFSVEDQKKFAELGGSSWLRVAVEKEIAQQAAAKAAKKAKAL